MICSAKRVVALVDHSKVGHDHFVRFASPSIIVTSMTEGAGTSNAPIAAVSEASSSAQ